jgi:hypothetical protein
MGSERLILSRTNTHQLGNDCGPTGLVVSAATAPGLPVKIFVEQDQLSPVRIGGVLQVLTVARASALAVW